MRKNIVSVAAVLLSVSALALVGCGAAPDDSATAGGTESALESDPSHAPTIPAGHYENVTNEEAIGSAFWVEDVQIDTNGTFTGILGCGVSNCSGHQFPITDGHYTLRTSGTTTLVAFSYKYDDGAHASIDTYQLRQGTKGAIQLRNNDEIADGAEWFTLDRVK